MTGLVYPADLRAWQAWAKPSGPAAAMRRLKHRVKPDVKPSTMWSMGPLEAPVVIVLDSLSPTALLALERPLRHLKQDSVRLVMPTGALPPQFVAAAVREIAIDRGFVGSKVVVSTGHYAGLGSAGYAHANSASVPYVVVQHGLITPYNPPLASGAHLMAWSQADADFWASGRTDVTAEVIGSQLLWEAARNPAPETALAHDDLPLTYLGQLHGAELPRRDMARSTGAFCRATGATYRPHPAERDKLSRAQHAIWRRQGITIDDGAVPLASLNTPVVSAFSTGVLEASAKGIPAWVHYDNPPAWLTEFWQRYGMAQFGGEPTPEPALPAQEPAALLAERITAMLGE